MEYRRLSVIIYCLFLAIITNAQDCFQLDLSANTTVCRLDSKPITSSTAYKLPIGQKRISGLSLSGQVTKNSPEYVVRVILKDNSGKEYLVMETYEELNSHNVSMFENYCEESIKLDNIQPDSIKVFLKDATLQISSLIVKDEGREVATKEQKREIKRRQVDNVISRINEYNRSKGRPWGAGVTEISMQPYEIRKRLLGFSDDTPSGGIEYYTSGFFVVGHGTIHATRSLDNDPFVDSFDWRNRHGRNWVTDIRHQGYTSYCTAFAALGCLESLTKLYFNNSDLELDLSEQEIASCYDSYPHEFWETLSYSGVMNYIYENGVCDEAVYPLDTAGYYNIWYEPVCYSNAVIPNEFIKTGSPQTLFSPNLQDIKRRLIANGPLVSGWQPTTGSGHAMALVGYGKIQANDTISYYNPSSNYASPVYSVPSYYVGSTYWIFKNSYGNSGLHGGYYYLVFSEMIGNNNNVSIPNMVMPSYLGLPIISMNHTDDDIIVEDADGDGYYNWGIGSKPDSCPSWIPDIRDGDDSDNSKGGMNEYGHLSDIPLREPWTLTSDYVMASSNEMIYGNITIPYGRTLTITGAAICMGTTTITVQNGGTLIVNGGILANAAISLASGSSLFVRNGGVIYTRTGFGFNAPIGSIVEIEEGEICGPYKKE